MQKNVFQKCNIFRKFGFICLFLILSNNVFAATGSLFGKKDLRVTKTKWFDIIYPAENEVMAGIMYENSDRIYEEVTGLYNLKPSFRMPLVITPSVDRLNAFWTVAPYNHIVIYDTSISEVGELSTYTEIILSVFRHELTHAVTNNMKNKFWKGFSKVFGDPAVPGLAYISTGIAEGATLTSESSFGEGRLNDEYSKQPVKQAKLEGKFPSYYDVKGASDKYPYGSAYYFNGAFHQWLQNIYGMDSYAKFWFNLVNTEHLLVNKSFKEVYGISIKQAWKEFSDEYKVPAISPNPLTNSAVKDFFLPEGSYYSKYNREGRLFTSLTTSENILYWLDSSCDKIQYFPFENIRNSKPKTLFTFSGAEEINISKDGRFMAISYNSGNAPGTSARIKIYDFENKKFYSVEDKPLKNGAIIQNGKDYYLVANKYETPSNKIVINQLLIKENNLCGLQQVRETVQELNEYSFEFTQLKDGEFAYIRKRGLDYSIVLNALVEESKQEFTAPKEKMVIGNLSAFEDELYFSWTAPETMPRLGKLNLTAYEMNLTNFDLSGGVYEPVKVQNQIVYAGHFYEENRLFTCGEFSESDYEVIQISSIGDKEAIEQKENNNLNVNLEYTKYNPFEYFKRGILIPFSLYTTEYFGCNAAYSSDTATYLLGATYITSNPWSNGQNDLYTLSAGWNYLNNSFGLDISAQMGTDTQLFTSLFDIKNEFDRFGWKQTFGNFTMQSLVSFGKISYISFVNTFTAGVGRQDKRIMGLLPLDEFRFGNSVYFDCCGSEDETVYSTLSNVFAVGYSNVHRTSGSRFEKAGINASVAFEYRTDKAITGEPEVYVDGFNIYPSAKAYIPGYLPTRINLNLIPASSIFGYSSNPLNAGRSIMDLKTETVLFGMDVQKSAPVFSALYLNDFYISFGYAMTLAAGEMTKFGFQMPYLAEYVRGTFEGKATVLDAVYLKTSIEFTPNIGIFANSSYKMNLYGMISYSIRNSDSSYLPLRVYLGTQANF